MCSAHVSSEVLVDGPCPLLLEVPRTRSSHTTELLTIPRVSRRVGNPGSSTHHSRGATASRRLDVHWFGCPQCPAAGGQLSSSIGMRCSWAHAMSSCLKSFRRASDRVQGVWLAARYACAGYEANRLIEVCSISVARHTSCHHLG